MFFNKFDFEEKRKVVHIDDIDLEEKDDENKDDLVIEDEVEPGDNTEVKLLIQSGQ